MQESVDALEARVARVLETHGSRASLIEEELSALREVKERLSSSQERMCVAWCAPGHTAPRRPQRASGAGVSLCLLGGTARWYDAVAQACQPQQRAGRAQARAGSGCAAVRVHEDGGRGGDGEVREGACACVCTAEAHGTSLCWCVGDTFEPVNGLYPHRRLALTASRPSWQPQRRRSVTRRGGKRLSGCRRRRRRLGRSETRPRRS